MLRASVAAGTDIGLEAKRYMNEGDLVPDLVMIGVVEERLLMPDAGKGYILDGFPRTVPQAEALESLLKRMDSRIDHVLALEVGDEELVRRMGGRLVCSNCLATYHVENKPPVVPNVCDECGHTLSVRDDDRPEAIMHRLTVYRELTEPLFAFYAVRNQLRRIDASRSVDQVSETIIEVLDR